jgi:methylenetetrahydrofolate dehydrogenase (NADP+)/methenyltetrahydrofolate cyclohydrolase
MNERTETELATGTEPIVLDGKATAKAIEAETAERVRFIRERCGITPALATIIVGQDPASVTYVRMKGNACKRVGLDPVKVELPENSTTADVIAQIRCLNEDARIFGILLQHPMPPQIDERLCFDAIDIEKDADGVTSWNFGRMALGVEAFGSATPAGIMRLLERYRIPIAGKVAVVVGRSPILGKPMAMMLLAANATVTVCHSRTVNLPDVVRRADIVVGAVGKPRFIQADWIKPGAVLVDAGYNPGNIGDIDLENAAPRSAAYTPVPGGVGPMTISTLIEQTVLAAEKRLGIKKP